MKCVFASVGVTWGKGGTETREDINKLNFAHLKQSLRCSNGGLKQRKRKWCGPLSWKLLVLDLSVVGSQWRKCEVFKEFKVKNLQRCQCEARLCGVAVLCQTQVAGEPCGHALSAYSGGCQCQVMRIGLLSGNQEFLFLHRKSSTPPFTLPSPLQTRHVLGLLGALTIC